jgi:SAM-dependent methyltransferase
MMFARERILIKRIIKRIAPKLVLELYSTIRKRNNRSKYSQMTVADVFSSIYRKNVWGGNAGEYCSGAGSCEEYAIPYRDALFELIRKNRINSIVDLGCGDFRIGKLLAESGIRYTGVDIVPELIDRNNRAFGGGNVSFQCIDIVDKSLPAGELCLIRQVFQHLSNEQIVSVLSKTNQYKWVVVTEHFPADCDLVVPNINKPHGPDTRITDNSGVYLDRPPFNVANIEMILELDIVVAERNRTEKIRSFLINNN